MTLYPGGRSGLLDHFFLKKRFHSHKKYPCAKNVSSANYYNHKISNTLVSKSANRICICIIQVWRVLPRAGWKWGTSMKESSSSLLSLVTLPPGSSRAGTEPSGSAGCDVLARQGGDCLLPAPFRATCTHSASPVNHNQPSVKLSTGPLSNFQVKIICIKLNYNNDPLQRVKNAEFPCTCQSGRTSS